MIVYDVKEKMKSAWLGKWKDVWMTILFELSFENKFPAFNKKISHILSIA